MGRGGKKPAVYDKSPTVQLLPPYLRPAGIQRHLIYFPAELASSSSASQSAGQQTQPTVLAGEAGTAGGGEQTFPGSIWVPD